MAGTLTEIRLKNLKKSITRGLMRNLRWIKSRPPMRELPECLSGPARWILGGRIAAGKGKGGNYGREDRRRGRERKELGRVGLSQCLGWIDTNEYQPGIE